MTRSTILLLALLAAGCGGGGAPTPSVRSNTDEVKGRREEIKALGDVPSDASKEVPRLLAAMNDPDPEVRWRAEFALGRVQQPRALKALTVALRDDSPKIRWAAAYALGPLGKNARSTVPALLNALSDKEAAVRVWSVKSLGDIDPGNSDVVAAFLRTLRDPDPDVRRVTLAILIRLGPAAAGSANVLVDVLQDADAGIRAQACIAFRQLATDGKAGIPALITRLSDPDLHVRSCASQALMKIGPGGLAPLVRALKERDPKARRAAAEIIGTFGSEAKSAAVELTDAAKDEDTGVQKAAADAIKKVQMEGGDAGANKGTTFIESPEAINRRVVGLKWAKVGLFVNWGIYSVAARAKPGQLAEEVMENDKIPVKEYEHFALKFGADQFKPDEWAKLANESGARYVVVSAKSPDGFCLWNTKLTEFSAVRLAAARRDLLGELAAACTKAGVKFCASYSLLDRHHPDYENNFPKYVDYVHGQLKELLAAYPIWGLWFDGEGGHSKEEWRADEMITMIRQSKPLAFVNDRIGRDARGMVTGVDFYTQEPDATPAALRLQGRPLAWEVRRPFGESWGYTESLDPLKSGERMIVDMVETVSKGGNFVINVGPRPDGTIPEAFQERLKVVGAWLRKNGEAIYDTERSPFSGSIPAGRVTAKGSRLYVFLEQLPESGIIALPGLKTKVREAWVVDGKIELKIRDTGVQAPGDLVEGSPVTVVAIELEGPPEVAK
jgi:alpha-L-fucosidase